MCEPEEQGCRLGTALLVKDRKPHISVSLEKEGAGDEYMVCEREDRRHRLSTAPIHEKSTAIPDL